MEKEEIFAALALLLIVIIGGIILLTQQKPPPSPSANETPLNKTQARILLGAIEKMERLGDYKLSFDEEESGLNFSFTIISRAGKKLGIVLSPVDERRVYIFRNETYVCEKYKGMRCASTQNSSILSEYADRISAQFIEPGTLRRNKRINEILIEKGAISFDEKIENRSIKGIPCTQLSYSTDYSKLSLEELSEIGMSVREAELSSSRNLRTIQCINEETGISLFSSLSYSAGGKRFTWNRTLSEFSRSPSESLELPVALEMNTTEFEEYFLSAGEELAKVLKCARKEGDERENCFKTLAFETKSEDKCNYIRNRTKYEQCIIVLLAKIKDPSLCEKTKELSDGCYFEAAMRNVNASICEKIKNESAREFCKKEVAKLPPPPKPIRECNEDSDCWVQGKWGELCSPRSKGFITTEGEKRPEYECYKKTSCGCVENKCRWKPNEEYLKCIEEHETPPPFWNSGG